jgi:hypothetical protein
VQKFAKFPSLTEVVTRSKECAFAPMPAELGKLLQKQVLKFVANVKSRGVSYELLVIVIIADIQTHLD